MNFQKDTAYLEFSIKEFFKITINLQLDKNTNFKEFPTKKIYEPDELTR